MSFARPDLLWLAVALPLIVAIALYAYVARRRRVAALLGEPALVRRLVPTDLHRFALHRLVLLGAAAVFVGLAAAGPRWGWRAVEGPDGARNIVLAVDVSKSMWARDIEPNRLERQRLLIRRLMRELQGERIGLVAFAGRAHVLSPLTTDFGALELYVDALDPDIVSHGGSSVATAIRQATDLARGATDERADRAVILMTDGEALEDEAAATSAAERAAAAGVVVHTIGMGTAAGAPVPEEDAEGRIAEYLRWQGDVVVSRLDDSLLRRIASLTGGAYFHVEDAGATERLLFTLRNLDRSPLEQEEGRRMVERDRFPWFVAAALFFLAIDAVLARRAEASPSSAGGPRPAGPRHASQRRGHRGRVIAGSGRKEA